MNKRITAAALALVGVTTAALGIVVPSTPAHAVYADCNTRLEHRAQTGLDAYRAGAYCYQIGADTKVQAHLVRNGGPDYYSVWFTGTYIWRNTNWATCYAGCHDTYEIDHV